MTPGRRRRANLAVLAAATWGTLTVLASACSSDRTVVDVFAASSLTDLMQAVEEPYEATHPDIDLRFSFAGSNTLRRQILDGAPVDVFAAADVAFFDDVPDADPTLLAVNELTIVVAAESRVEGVDSLSEVLVARCAPGVPCGEATDRFLQARQAELGRVTLEPNVRAVLTKVDRGEVDAGFVYRTDALAAGLDQLPLDGGPTVDVGVAALGESADGSDFVEFLVSDETSELRTRLGFRLPPGGGS